ncbi:MAG: ankyrin repeat domain-containing protein, partial [Candidatus Acidiferrales bacterium]
MLLAAQVTPLSAQSAQGNLDAALLAATEKGDAGAVSALLQKKARVDARDERGFTALAIAASLGHTPVVEVLLKAGADPDAQTRSGSTPLLFAAFGGHTETIAALLRAPRYHRGGRPVAVAPGSRGAGARPDRPDRIAARVNHRTPDGITALMMAANAGHAAAITQLAEAGAHIDAADNAGRTALMLAAAKGHVAAVQALIEAGAAVDPANQWGDTALTWAANEGHTAAVEILLAAGAGVEAKNKQGATALLLASRGGFFAMLPPLLTAGARTDATDENGRTALMFAAFNGHTAVVKALLAAKAAPNTADHKGQTALMHAATQGHAAAVEAMLAAGADANATTSNGSTALMSAAFWGRRAAIAALLAAGADPTLKDSAGKTAADLARDAGHADLLPLFAEHVAQAVQPVTRKDPAPTPSPEAGASGLGAKPTPTAEAPGSKPTPTPEGRGTKPTPTPEAPASGKAPASATAAKNLPRFEDVTTQAGITFTHTNGATPEKHMPETMGSGGLFFDFDNDGWLDIFLVNGGSIADPEISKRARYPLYRNNRDGTLTDVTARSGITPLRYGMGACAADYDNDGWTDLYITGFEGNALYRNNGGRREFTRDPAAQDEFSRDGNVTFTDVTAKAGAAVNSWSTSCAWADFDKDGHLDLYIVNYVDFSLTKNLFCGDTVQRVRAYCHPHAYTGLDDVLLRNNGDGTFTDISKKAGISGVAGPRAGKGLGVV